MSHRLSGAGPARLIALAIALFLVAFAALPARAEEVIQSFNSAVRLGTNGTVDVIETITVRTEADQIRHGIYRDIPTQLINADNSRLRSTLTVVEVKRDGQPEPYSVENVDTPSASGPDTGRFKRIRIG